MMSYPENIVPILKAVEMSGAKEILDVGPGFGKYGLLIRESYLSRKASGGELIPTDDIKIIAVELTDYFLTGKNGKRLYSIYDDVAKGNIWELNIVQDSWLVLLIDIIEHYDKKLVLDWIKKCPGKILVSTPKRVAMYTEHFYGDPHHHITQWEIEDFTGLDYVDISTPQSHILLINPTQC